MRAADERGGLDVLVNNAGIIHVAPLARGDATTAGARLMAVNATGTLLGMQAAIPAMRAPAAARSSTSRASSAPTGAEGYVAYTASKGAAISMTKIAALEHAADGIRVNAICPGRRLDADERDEPRAASSPLTPLGRRAHASEISARRRLSWPATTAGFVTGAELVIDGGYLAR